MNPLCNIVVEMAKFKTAADRYLEKVFASQEYFPLRFYLEFTFPNLLGGPGFAAADMDGDGFADPYVCDMTTGKCMVLLSRIDSA